MPLRKTLLKILDRTYLRLASRKYGLFGPTIIYQPLPWIGLVEGKRAQGSQKRLKAILECLDGMQLSPEVVLDIGANNGYFSLSFAEKGVLAYAVEGDETNIRLGVIASRRLSELKGAFVPILQWCEPGNIGFLPRSDVTLCLSIWHHWVRRIGLDGATLMLKSLLDRTSTALFFDTGEDEMPVHYNLPFGANEAKTWLTSYLEGLGQVEVTCLGRFEAFAPGSRENDQCVTRHLFVLRKVSSGTKGS